MGAVIEARGEERFNLLAQDLADRALRSFYKKISSSEARHFTLFLNLATKYFNRKTVEGRLSEWVEIEKLKKSHKYTTPEHTILMSISKDVI